MTLTVSTQAIPGPDDGGRPAGENRVAVSDPASVAVVTVTGDIDVMNAGQLRELLLEQFSGGLRHFVLDLSDVTFLDSTGLGVLVATHRRTRNGAGSLRLVVTSRALLQLLRMTGLNQVLRVYATLDEALTSVRAEPVRQAVLPASGAVAPRLPLERTPAVSV